MESHADGGPSLVMVPTTSQLLAFVLASILFIQVPGPSLLFTIGRALTVGRRAALLSVLGNALGLIAQIVAVALGLGAVVAASAAAYTVLKIVGAGWVVWLGIQAIRHRGDARVALGARRAAPAERTSAAAADRLRRRVPPTPRRSSSSWPSCRSSPTPPPVTSALQVALLGALFGGAWPWRPTRVWALAAGRARDWFARKPQRLDAMGAAGGVMMIGLGATLAATEPELSPVAGPRTASRRPRARRPSARRSRRRSRRGRG